MIIAKYPKSQNAKIAGQKIGSIKKSHLQDGKWLPAELAHALIF
jgi:hypothetical protein